MELEVIIKFVSSGGLPQGYESLSLASPGRISLGCPAVSRELPSKVELRALMALLPANTVFLFFVLWLGMRVTLKGGDAYFILSNQKVFIKLVFIFFLQNISYILSNSPDHTARK